MKKSPPQIRKGQAPAKRTRDEVRSRFETRFFDPRFSSEREAIERLSQIAWENYRDGRKAPITQPGGSEFADPSYEISVEWLATRAKLKKAAEEFADPNARSRVLVINASSRNDGSCPSEMSKSYRLATTAKEKLERNNLTVDLLDLSLLTSEPELRIFPCKSCVSTAMPLCHWPCSCYPNHSLGQVGDWMAEIYERFTRAHGILIVTPVYWHQAPSPLKLMMDRLVCADGGNPDPSSTHGKKADEAKAIEMKGWDYPKHLAGRVFGVVAHGDTAGAETVRRSLVDWLEDMGLISAGPKSHIDRYIGYYDLYATSHDALDADQALFREVEGVAEAVMNAVAAMRKGTLSEPDRDVVDPRPK